MLKKQELFEAYLTRFFEVIGAVDPCPFSGYEVLVCTPTLELLGLINNESSVLEQDFCFVSIDQIGY